MRKLYDRIRSLKNTPYLGRAGHRGNARACVSPLPYIAVYRVREQSIEVWRIYHTAQQRP
jgi:plasmid stabilization system protein ParE